MPLDLGALTDGLESIFNSGAATAVAAGNSWAGVADEFAQTGAANGVPSSVPGAAVDGLASALGGAFANLAGTAASCASAIASALDLFWPQVVFAGQMAPPVPGGGAALITTLTSIFSNVGGTAESKAAEIANAILAYTNLVIVTFPPGNPFPVI